MKEHEINDAEMDRQKIVRQAKRRKIDRSMQLPDDHVIEFDYVDAKGTTTRRAASPFRYVGKDRFLALCLVRADLRIFHIDSCQKMEIKPAHNFLMPVTFEDA